MLNSIRVRANLFFKPNDPSYKAPQDDLDENVTHDL